MISVGTKFVKVEKNNAGIPLFVIVLGVVAVVVVVVIIVIIVVVVIIV